MDLKDIHIFGILLLEVGKDGLILDGDGPHLLALVDNFL